MVAVVSMMVVIMMAVVVSMMVVIVVAMMVMVSVCQRRLKVLFFLGRGGVNAFRKGAYS